VAAAWIGFAGGVIAAVISAVVALRQTRLSERLTRLDHELEAQTQAEGVLKRYREPLAAAAFDLQSRLYNVIRLDFFNIHGDGSGRAEEAWNTTLFRLAQYFGWTEIMRRDIQFLSFPEDEETRRVAQLQSEISKRFLTNEYGPALMIWGDEQRAIGELMIVEEYGKVLCMGYAKFQAHCDDEFATWHQRLRAELGAEPAQTRIREVQHLLCELVETLDSRRLRYAEDLERA
jgi:hypothetical protein